MKLIKKKKVTTTTELPSSDRITSFGRTNNGAGAALTEDLGRNSENKNNSDGNKNKSIDNTCHSSSDDDRHDSSNDNEVVRIEDSRHEEGLCPSCGIKLYKIKKKTIGGKKFWKRRKNKNNDKDASNGNTGDKKHRVVVKRKPLSIQGVVERGQCLNCTGVNKNGSATDSADMLAAAFVAATIDSNEQRQNKQKPQGSNGNCYSNGINNDSISQTNGTGEKEGNVLYIGPFNSYGQRDGRGELLWSNGDRYIGEFFNGRRHGEGTLYFASKDGGINCDAYNGGEYVGTWECNLMHGEGTRRFPNGDVYTGEYIDGKRCGQGKIFFANGDMYNGGWFNDCMHGVGKYHYNNGQRFEGTFTNNKRHGKGKLQHLDGSLDIYNYVNDTRMDPGVRWSSDRKKAWKLSNNGQTKWISVDRAIRIGLEIDDRNKNNNSSLEVC